MSKLEKSRQSERNTEDLMRVVGQKASQFKLRKGVPSRKDTLKNFQKNFLRNVGVFALALLVVCLRIIHSMRDGIAEIQKSERNIYIYLGAIAIVGTLVFTVLHVLLSHFYISWTFDKNASTLVFKSRNFLRWRRKTYNLNDFCNICLLQPGKTFWSDYRLMLVRRRKGFLDLRKKYLMLDRMSTDSEDKADAIRERYQEIEGAVRSFMGWS